MKRKPRIIVADEHRILAEAVKSVLEPEFEVVGIVSNGHELLHAAFQLIPDVVILNVSMRELNGLDAGEMLKKKLPSVKLVYVTENTSTSIAAEAFRRGASAYVIKQSTIGELLTAVRTVLKGQAYLPSQLAKEILSSLLATNNLPERLVTARQVQILQLIVEGKTMKDIAHRFSLKTRTVAFHKYRMMRRLGLTTNAELVRYAIEHDIVT